jgi:hypothetical protein
LITSEFDLREAAGRHTSQTLEPNGFPWTGLKLTALPLDYSMSDRIWRRSISENKGFAESAESVESAENRMFGKDISGVVNANLVFLRGYRSDDRKTEKCFFPSVHQVVYFWSVNMSKSPIIESMWAIPMVFS